MSPHDGRHRSYSPRIEKERLQCWMAEARRLAFSTTRIYAATYGAEAKWMRCLVLRSYYCLAGARHACYLQQQRTLAYSTHTSPHFDSNLFQAAAWMRVASKHPQARYVIAMYASTYRSYRRMSLLCLSNHEKKRSTTPRLACVRRPLDVRRRKIRSR